MEELRTCQDAVSLMPETERSCFFFPLKLGLTAAMMDKSCTPSALTVGDKLLEGTWSMISS